jgi:hypothetical protein
VPSVAEVMPEYSSDKVLINAPPAQGMGMVYYVDGPAVDFDGDGRLDIFGGSWSPEGSRLFRNVTPQEVKASAGEVKRHWLQVRVEGKQMNRMGVGAKVSVYTQGKAGDPSALLGYQEISVNVGYSSSRPAVAHFGLGEAATCDVEVRFPSRAEPLVLADVEGQQRLIVREP